MSESDKSGKLELSNDELTRISKEAYSRYTGYDGTAMSIGFRQGAEWATLHERSAAQARIAELEIEYKDLKNSIQQFFQVLIARNYNNIGEWSNERQQYNFELIQEIENLLIKHNSKP